MFFFILSARQTLYELAFWPVWLRNVMPAAIGLVCGRSSGVNLYKQSCRPIGQTRRLFEISWILRLTLVLELLLGRLNTNNVILVYPPYEL
jgi:hypothetical protein